MKAEKPGKIAMETAAHILDAMYGVLPEEANPTTMTVMADFIDIAIDKAVAEERNKCAKVIAAIHPSNLYSTLKEIRKGPDSEFWPKEHPDDA